MKVVSVLLGLLGLMTTRFAAQPPADSLLRAIYPQHAAAWEAWVKAKVDVGARDAKGNTPLRFAALNHDVAAMRALLAAGVGRLAHESSELLLKAGSGEPAVISGHGAGSAMIQYVSAKIDDLGMPPLDRRKNSGAQRRRA
jgi:ankyrin repeat protein